MAQTLVKLTTTKDPRNYYTTEKVWESFEAMTASADARSWTQTITDGKYTLTETYTDEIPDPSGGGGNVFPDTWSVEVSTAAEPIESHPQFATVSDADWKNIKTWKANSNDPSLNGWTPAQSGTTGAFYEQLINRNVQSYLAPKIVIKHTYTSTSVPDLGAIGKINFPTFAAGIGPAGVDYILTGATAVQSGTVYRISKEWLGSALGGWDPVLYGNPV